MINYPFVEGVVMRLIGMLVVCMTLLFSENLHQKLIVKGERNSTHVVEDLAALKGFFQMNSEAKALQEKYHLSLTLEQFGAYRVVVIKPISQRVLKQRLQELFTTRGSEIFFVRDRSVIPKTNQAPIALDTPPPIEQSWINIIGLQWSVLLLLSLIGLLLSLYNRQTLRSIKQEQVILGEEQKKMEKQINNLGERDV